MAIRRRTIQPSIWQDPDFGTLNPVAQLVFIGLITQADDEGRLQGHPAVISSMLFPYRTVELEQVMDALQEISHRMKNTQFYEVDRQLYIQLSNWYKHQSLREDRMQKSLIPKPPDNQVSTSCQPTAPQVSKVSKESKLSNGTILNKNIERIDGPLERLRKELEDKGILKKTKLL